MPRYVAFLRGMNLGGRRIKNPELCAAFETLGFREVVAFLASGNVVFEGKGSEAKIRAMVERGLARELGYDVPTFVRSDDQVRALATATPFADREGADERGKLQVIFLQEPPAKAARQVVAAHDGADDWLEVQGRELFWWPRGGISESELDLKALTRALGPTTIRTMRTVERLADKYLSVRR